MDLAVFRFEYLQGTKQEFWILLADAVTDPGKTPFADLRNQRHGPRRHHFYRSAMIVRSSRNADRAVDLSQPRERIAAIVSGVDLLHRLTNPEQ